MQYLLSKGADINATSTAGRNCLYAASEFGQLEIVKYILRNHQIDINKQKNNSSLFIAAVYGHIDVVNELLNISFRNINRNIDLEIREETDGMTPLLGSCFVGKVDVIKILVDNGADLMATTTDGTNCLILAAGMVNAGKIDPHGKGGNGHVIEELLRIQQVQLHRSLHFRNN